jgi:hypothetical protein
VIEHRESVVVLERARSPLMERSGRRDLVALRIELFGRFAFGFGQVGRQLSPLRLLQALGNLGCCFGLAEADHVVRRGERVVDQLLV